MVLLSNKGSFSDQMENKNGKYDPEWITNVHVNLWNVNQRVKEIAIDRTVTEKANQAAWLLKAITMIDLTTLAGDDTKTNVQRLCFKAAHPLSSEFLEKLGFDITDKTHSPITTAAVCVYPTRVRDAHEALTKLGIAKIMGVAAVATGFPTGSYPIKTRLEEIRYAVSEGATEIDVVIDRSLVLGGEWQKLFEELQLMREACGKDIHLKVILAIGELGTMENVYKASMLSMIAGADFIKTSTGKEGVNATLAVGLVMCRAIREFYRVTNRKVGLKPAGGIRTPTDAINWLILVKEELGDDWLNPTLFRIGASGVLGNIEKWFYTYLTGRTPESHEFTFM